MAVVVVTGSAGLIGSEVSRHYAAAGDLVIGIDNDLRGYFFGPEASTTRTARSLVDQLGDRYVHVDADIRDRSRIEAIFTTYGSDIAAVVHTAGQPSHDWAAREPVTDFEVNTTATMLLLEATRLHAPGAKFVFTSTNKVYGDSPNRLPLVELDTRWDLPVGHPRYAGIDETMSIDQSLHSLFGVSKLAADVLAQEYGRYFGMATAVFRCGCVTGTGHAGTALHGFLSYLVRCFKEDRTYDVIGYAGKQVRDNIVSSDVVSAIDAYLQAELTGARVYNLGGGRANSCSIVEAVEMCREISGRSLTCRAVAQPRVGDHLWYISDLGKALTDLPGWRITAGLEDILTDMFDPQPAVL